MIDQISLSERQIETLKSGYRKLIKNSDNHTTFAARAAETPFSYSYQEAQRIVLKTLKDRGITPNRGTKDKLDSFMSRGEESYFSAMEIGNLVNVIQLSYSSGAGIRTKIKTVFFNTAVQCREDGGNSSIHEPDLSLNDKRIIAKEVDRI